MLNRMITGLLMGLACTALIGGCTPTPKPHPTPAPSILGGAVHSGSQGVGLPDAIIFDAGSEEEGEEGAQDAAVSTGGGSTTGTGGEDTCVFVPSLDTCI